MPTVATPSAPARCVSPVSTPTAHARSAEQRRDASRAASRGGTIAPGIERGEALAALALRRRCPTAARARRPRARKRLPERRSSAPRATASRARWSRARARRSARRASHASCRARRAYAVLDRARRARSPARCAASVRLRSTAVRRARHVEGAVVEERPAARASLPSRGRSAAVRAARDERALQQALGIDRSRRSAPRAASSRKRAISRQRAGCQPAPCASAARATGMTRAHRGMQRAESPRSPLRPPSRSARPGNAAAMSLATGRLCTTSPSEDVFTSRMRGMSQAMSML